MSDSLHGFGPQALERVIGPGEAFDDLITATGGDGHVGFDPAAACTR